MRGSNPFLDAALFYAQRKHWPVFPLKPRSKDPLTAHGFKDASTDEKQIRLWWERWPDANIGIPTGEEFWVLDVDPRHGGEESRAALEQKYGKLRDTLRQKTGGGGWQYLYRMPEQAVIRNATEVCGWKGIDVRGVGGYIVVPPSIHPDPPHNPYVWDTARRTILEEPLEPADPWLVIAILRHGAPGAGRAAAAGGGPVELPEVLAEGARDTTLFRMACAFRRARAEFTEVVAQLVAYDQQHCRPPLGAAYVTEKVRSAFRYPAGENAPPAGTTEKAPLVRVRGGAITDGEYRARKPLIEPILYPGLTILAGRPKLGKGWFAFQMAIALATAGRLAGYFDVDRPYRVLYLSLEDRDWQVQYRQRQLGIPREVMEKIEWSFELAEPLMTGGAAILDASLTASPVDVLIVDSQLAIVRQAKREGMDIMQADYNIANTLRQIAEKHEMAVQLINHTTKTTREYALDAVQGTTGNTAATDSAWVMQRGRDGQTTLATIGRQVPENLYALTRAEGSPAWIITGEGDEIAQSEARQDILQLLRDNGPMKPTQMAGKLHKNISGVHRLLVSLCDQGSVLKTSYGTYQIGPPRVSSEIRANGRDL